MRRLLVLVALVFALDARAVTIDWVAVGNPNNLPDAPSTNCYAANCGSVDHAYSISKYEVTNAQYAEFLNAKATSDPLGLYNPSMDSDATFGGITQSGVSGSYSYTVKPGFTNKPVNYVSFYDSLRFSNWLNNGEGIGDTETGAYTITVDGITNNTITRNPGATVFLPSENEWYKAAYYSPTGVYFEYPAGTSTQTACLAPGVTANTANCNNVVGVVTVVGAYTGSASPYGTFDQGGNVLEWNEQIVSGSFRGFRGGSWDGLAGNLAASYPSYNDPTNEYDSVGFRVASLVPVTIDWVPVGNAGNEPDSPSTNCYSANCGSVAYDYLISKYEVTNAQYAEFLNAKAASDPLGLYHPSMDSDATFGGITQSGVSGSFTYTVKAGFTNKPVNYVSFYDSLRFSNWLNNGQGLGDTETGAYTLLGGTAIPSNGLTVKRNGGANSFLPSENEWYKAAYYSPGGVYFDYPTGTDTETGCVAPGSDTGNSANCSSAVGALTNAGAYGLSDSPYGTYDQGGNVWEWTEQIVILDTSYRGLRGGCWNISAGFLAASYPNFGDPADGFADFGFRVASSVPEPDAGLLGMMGVLSVLGLATSRRRRAN